jgi:uncharacterized protein YecE (DUF72 family)
MPKTRAAAKTRDRVQRRVKKSEIRIGISGWRYAGWRGKFYPKDLPQRRELEFAANTFSSVEINGSFYSLQLPSSYQRWYHATPADFLFAVKGGRFITHMKKLRGVETALANFFASGILALREKLGPILWQLPPSLGFDAGRIKDFFDLLPRNTGEAAALARKHDDKLKARAFSKIDISRPIRHAIEVRHQTFMVQEFFDLLRKHRIAFVIADTAGKFPYAEDLTADFVYIRLHGAEKLYVSGYNDRALDWWANRIERWRRGRQPRDAKLIAVHKADNKSRNAFVYFDNDAKVHAPFDAIRLAKRLRLRD